jgi:hypothetical protein
MPKQLLLGWRRKNKNGSSKQAFRKRMACFFVRKSKKF